MMNKVLSHKLLSLLLIGLILFSPISAFATDPASWDIADINCSDLTGWDTSLTQINGVVEVSPASQFHLENTAGGSPADNSIAYIKNNFSALPDTVTFEVKTYFEALGDTSTGNNYFMAMLFWNDARFIFHFRSDGLFIFDGAAFNEVGTDLITYGGSATWQTWRFLIDMTTPASATCDVYLGTTLVGDNVDCSATGTYTDGDYKNWLYAWDMATEMHIDWIKAADGLYIPVEIIDDSQILMIN